jgi:hypothetical protein
MKNIKTSKSYDSNKKVVVCDEGVCTLVTSTFNDATIYARNSNSGVISTLKTLLSKGYTDITYVIDVSNETSVDKRLEFMSEFMGSDFEKIDVVKSSEL